jgi:DNA-binding GntR family transcriptional regulator
MNIDFLTQDVEFHNTIYRATDNEIIAKVVRAIHNLTVGVWLAVGQIRDVPSRICDDHERVFAALRNRDGEAAEAAMRQHLKETVAVLTRAAGTSKELEEVKDEFSRTPAGSLTP